MTELERLRINKQELELGNFIINNVKRHKKIGVFTRNNDYLAQWTKSMFHLQEIGDCELEDGEDISNIANYSMAILIEFKFNNKTNEIRFKKTTSSQLGLGSFVPVILIEYCLMHSKYIPEQDSEYIVDGISAAKAKS